MQEIHDQTPPGALVMQELKVAIDFRFDVTSHILMENQPNKNLLPVPATDARRKRLNTNRLMTSVSRTLLRAHPLHDAGHRSSGPVHPRIDNPVDPGKVLPGP